jgi:hypothetical protein
LDELVGFADPEAFSLDEEGAPVEPAEALPAVLSEQPARAATAARPTTTRCQQLRMTRNVSDHHDTHGLIDGHVVRSWRRLPITLDTRPAARALPLPRT